MRSSPSIREVARLAKVSVATVSKSLNNKTDVSEATRKRVLALCRKLGYRQNPLVAALMRSRRRHTPPTQRLTLAFVSSFDTADGWRQHPSPIFRQLFAGAEARAAERSYRLEHFWLYRDGMSNLRFSEVLLSRGIRGLLFAPVPYDHTPIELQWTDFSVVVLGITPSTNRFNRVATDYYQSMLLAMERCALLGYKRPGLAVRSETNSRLEFRWEAAYYIASKQFELQPVTPLLVTEWTTENVGRWLKKERPDVVIGPVLGRLEELVVASGARIPDDIGMVGLLVPQTGDRLSGVLQDGEIIGAVSVDQLISQLERNETGIPDHPVTHTMLGRWNPGRTIRLATD